MKRKTFLQTAAGAAAIQPLAPFAIGKPGKSANGKLNIAFIGAGGWIAQEPYNQGCEVKQKWKASPPSRTIPRVEGGSFREWIRAIKGEGPEPGSNFKVAANLTEIILLGVLAQRFDTRIEWDAKAGRITNRPELNAFVKEPARRGWRFGETL